MRYYVILTGSKNNAGDFLIKYRAKQLFKSERPDRKIIDFNAWEKFDDEKLEIVNNSEALILMGGPALQYDMWPGIYRLTDDLNDIKVPIIIMGIGWYSKDGNWDDTYNYPLSDNTLELLAKVNQSGYQLSVRDYHTLNSLEMHNVNNVIMTGCPAYYDLDYIGREFEPSDIETVAFSLGVSFVNSTNAERLMKNNILALKKHFNHKRFIVTFHHSLDTKEFLSFYKNNVRHIKKHKSFARWLKKHNIDYIDISGSAEKLIGFYSTVDLHIGYRVHAHIFMNSISKPSILISEDGRGKAVFNVINGLVLNSFLKINSGVPSRLLGKLNLIDKHVVNKVLTTEIIQSLNYESQTKYNRIKVSRKIIDQNYLLMQEFISQLP